jgi:hypothetical protein
MLTNFQQIYNQFSESKYRGTNIKAQCFFILIGRNYPKAQKNIFTVAF